MQREQSPPVPVRAARGQRRSTISTPAIGQTDALPPGEVLDIESPPWHGQPWSLLPTAPLGQTFRARHGGLCAVEVLVAVESPATGELICCLSADGPDGTVLYSQSLPVASLSTQRFARFVLPPLLHSAGRRFYWWLEAATPGVAVYAAGQPRLADGSAYRAHEPVDGCLVFRTFAAAPDARLADRRQIEALLTAQAELSRELVAARSTMRQLADERATLHARLADLLTRLAPPAPTGSEAATDG